MEFSGEYAGFWRRFAAFSIDTMLLGVAQTVASIVMVALIPGAEISEEVTVGYVIAFNLLGFIAMWLYFAAMESSSKRATLGKMMIGIVVSDMAGDRITFGRASARYFAKIPSWIILAIGFLMAGFTKRKQALHDIMAGCLVIRKPKPAAEIAPKSA